MAGAAARTLVRARSGRSADPARAALQEWGAMGTDFPDSHRDLLDARFAPLATLGKDGARS